MRNSVRVILLALAAALFITPVTGPAHADSVKPPRTLQKYVADTWRSVDAMVDPRTGLPADNVGGSLKAGTRAAYTSPTNIGAYLWSTAVARDTGLISKRDA